MKVVSCIHVEFIQSDLVELNRQQELDTGHQVLVSLSKWNYPLFAFPKSFWINLGPVETNLQMFIRGLWSIHKSGNLNMKLGWGLWRPDIQRLSWRRFQRATFQKLQNVQHINIFLSRNSIVWTLQIYNTPKSPALCCRAHYANNDDGTREIESVSREMIPNYIYHWLGNVTATLLSYTKQNVRCETNFIPQNLDLHIPAKPWPRGQVNKGQSEGGPGVFPVPLEQATSQGLLQFLGNF